MHLRTLTRLRVLFGVSFKEQKNGLEKIALFAVNLDREYTFVLNLRQASCYRYPTFYDDPKYGRFVYRGKLGVFIIKGT
jgi:hypothetical protein